MASAVILAVPSEEVDSAQVEEEYCDLLPIRVQALPLEEEIVVDLVVVFNLRIKVLDLLRREILVLVIPLVGHSVQLAII